MHDAEVHGDDPMLEKWGQCRPVPAGAGRCRAVRLKVHPVAGRCRLPASAGGRPVPVAGRCRWPAVAGRCRPVPGLYTT